MKRIGITGGIGSGKTYVCRILERMGVPVFYCDEQAKRLMVESERIREQLTALLGAHVYCSDGTLNKPLLADYLFSDKHHADRINGIVHPVVKQSFCDFVLQQTDGVRFCAMESAILFESGFTDVVDVTFLVDAPWELRLKRAMQRDAAGREQIEARMRSQMSDEERRHLADYCIVNDGVHDVESQVENLLAGL